MSGKAIARIGDKTDHGGVVISGEPTIMINNIPIARIGDMVSCPKCEGTYPIISGVDHFFGQGKLVAVVGSKTACGATIITGAPTATAGGPLVTASAPSHSNKDVILGMGSVGDWLSKDRTVPGKNLSNEELCAAVKAVKSSKNVQSLTNEAWRLTQETGLEHGGWILEDPPGEYKIVELRQGTPSTVNLGEKPENAIAKFHTHTNGKVGASPQDEHEASTAQEKVIFSMVFVGDAESYIDDEGREFFCD